MRVRLLLFCLTMMACALLTVIWCGASAKGNAANEAATVLLAPAPVAVLNAETADGRPAYGTIDCATLDANYTPASAAEIALSFLEPNDRRSINRQPHQRLIRLLIYRRGLSDGIDRIANGQRDKRRARSGPLT